MWKAGAVPKKVDHHERREQIASALMRVAARDGLEAVSLRHVAAEAGVTSGMVQHYFPTKDQMMLFAMRSASARYEQRMAEAVGELGEHPAPRDLVGAVLRTLLPTDEEQQADARVALAFQSYAALNPPAADGLSSDGAQFRAFIADLVRDGRPPGGAAAAVDPTRAATALFAVAEGLGVHMLSSGLPVDAALSALEAQLDLTFGSDVSP